MLTGCCGGKPYNSTNQICCGPHGSEVILTKVSKDHICCGDKQYDPTTACCCGDPLRIERPCSSCCKEEQKHHSSSKWDKNAMLSLLMRQTGQVSNQGSLCVPTSASLNRQGCFTSRLGHIA